MILGIRIFKECGEKFVNLYYSTYPLKNALFKFIK